MAMDPHGLRIRHTNVMTMDSSLKRIKKQIFPHIPDRISGLVDLSYNLWWTWTTEAKMLFKQLHPHAWIESIHNPVKMLRDLPEEILKEKAANPQYLRHYDSVMERFARYMRTSSTWYSEESKSDDIHSIGYFSAEYGLHHSLPFYAGGLGFLAGDHLKECSDLGVPLVAAGFMYGQGYLHQHIRPDGWQEDVTEALDREAAPVIRVPVDGSEQAIFKVPFIDPPIHVAIWRVAVGRVPLFLMDTDILENPPAYRSIFLRLYAGDAEWRLRQEFVLGIGGCMMLHRVGIEPSILHLNEGHTAFALLERLRRRVDRGESFTNALEEVKRTSIFTTHTPVPAGHDRFPMPLVERFFSEYYPQLGLDRQEFLKLGEDPANRGLFNMTALAMRLCGSRNAVSREHAQVTRKMWSSLIPDATKDDAAIGYITNGVHLPTWLAPNIEYLIESHIGRFHPCWMEYHDSTAMWELIREIPDRELWLVHQSLKRQLFNRIREYKRWRWAEGRADPMNIVAGGTLLDPNALTIGFARRFTSYKRADLIFHDLERLKRMLNSRWRPIQIIFAGKAHPDDVEGKRIIQRVYRYAQSPEFGGRIAFVEDYGEQIAQYLVHGVDLWLNTPVRELEASGTSGMKAGMNGVLHLSIPTGWWLEGYDGSNGWVIGGGGEGGAKDEAESLYSTLENEVIPLYYTISEDGTPHLWIKKMKQAIASIAPRFSARRMVKEYVRKYYIPALTAGVKPE